MIILPQLVKMNWNNGNKNYYISKGYEFTKIRREFLVHVLDLSKQSHKEVKVYCDYCGRIIKKPFRYVKENNKDCCEKCSPLKLRENNLEKYGVGSAMEREDIKEKIIQSNLKKYGYKYTLQIPEIKERIKQTNLEKYNNPCSLHGEEIDKKARHTWIKKYGVDHPLKSQQIRFAIKRTNLEKYGCEFAQSSEEIKRKNKKDNFGTIWSYSFNER